jgi:hypothetical protein
MRLSQFVAQTIIEIIDGVTAAQAYGKEKDAEVNPAHVNWSDTKKAFHTVPGAIGKDQAPLLTLIDFDVLLTTATDDKAQGGIGVFAASLGIGVKGEAEERAETASRVKFQILAKLPQQR